MSREFTPTDDTVAQIHQLKGVTPSDWMTVRVERYSSKQYGDSAAVFVWDPNLSAPTADTDTRIASSEETFGPGGANEGAWDLLRPVGPVDEDIIVARPSGNVGRGFQPSDYASSDAAVNAADAYVTGNGGGIIRVPESILPLDYGTVSISSDVEVFVDQVPRLVTNAGDITTSGTGVYIADSSGSARTVTIREEEEVHGNEISVKRKGGNGVDLTAETDATINGVATHTISADGDVARLVYDQPNDNWELL